MNRNVFLVGTAALALVAMVIVGGFMQRVGRAESDAPAGAIRVTIASSSTKKEWIDASVKTFNDASRSGNQFRIGGKPIHIQVLQEELEPGKFDHYRSGTMVTDTLSGKITPTVVSPAEGSWIDQLNKGWEGTHGKLLVTGKPTPLVRTPLVIGMWQSRATAIGCWPRPTSNCSWNRLNELAANAEGWAMFGHPEWGKLKMGYGYVGESNSGTLTAMLLCVLGSGKTSEIQVEDVQPSTGCGKSMATLEGAKVHSGKKSSWLLGLMKDRGSEYLDAVTTYEQEVVTFNRENGKNLREPLVAVYPQDGTVVVEHPFAVLNGASWVTDDQKKAAGLFLQFLLSEGQQREVEQWGLRRVDPTAIPKSPIETRFGAIPDAPIVPVEVPSVLVVDRIIEVWHQVKKHAVVALVFDKSGSMEGQKLATALVGATAMVQAMDPQDELIWVPFDSRVYPGRQGTKGEIGEQLVGDIRSTTAAAGTALYDAIGEAYRKVGLREDVLGDRWRYGIVVLSDGQDTSSVRMSMAQLQALLAPSEGDPTAIQIHTIGVGSDADKGVLSRLATMAHGRYWDARDPARVVDSYREIAVHY
ncbi:MAG: VWA domain-containing protein [Tepidiformaceae bacterium]